MTQQPKHQNDEMPATAKARIEVVAKNFVHAARELTEEQCAVMLPPVSEGPISNGIAGTQVPRRAGVARGRGGQARCSRSLSL